MKQQAEENMPKAKGRKQRVRVSGQKAKAIGTLKSAKGTGNRQERGTNGKHLRDS